MAKTKPTVLFKKKSILLSMAFLIGCFVCACGKEDSIVDESLRWQRRGGPQAGRALLPYLPRRGGEDASGLGGTDLSFVPVPGAEIKEVFYQ